MTAWKSRTFGTDTAARHATHMDIVLCEDLRDRQKWVQNSVKIKLEDKITLSGMMQQGVHG